MKFRKKPVIIEAEQFTDYKHLPKGVYFEEESATGFLIDTLEGKHDVTLNDWIITGVKGEKYPCKPDVFEMTYEKI